MISDQRISVKSVIKKAVKPVITSEVLKLKSDSEKSVKSTKKISKISDKKSVNH